MDGNDRAKTALNETGASPARPFRKNGRAGFLCENRPGITGMRRFRVVLFIRVFPIDLLLFTGGGHGDAVSGSSVTNTHSQCSSVRTGVIQTPAPDETYSAVPVFLIAGRTGQGHPTGQTDRFGSLFPSYSILHRRPDAKKGKTAPRKTVTPAYPGQTAFRCFLLLSFPAFSCIM